MEMTDPQINKTDSGQDEVTVAPDGRSLAISKNSGNAELERQALPSRQEADRQFADFHEQYVSRYIVLADSKAGATFAVASGVFGYLVSWDNFMGALTVPSFNLQFVSATAASVLLVTAAAQAFWVVAPRRTTSGSDIVFWKSIAALASADDFIRKVTEATDASIVSDRLRHCYDLSRICSAKYDWLRRAMITGAGGIVAACVAKFVIQ